MNDNKKSVTRQQPGQDHRQTAAEKVVDEMKEAQAGASDELLEAIMDEEGRPETAEQAQAEKDRADISQELFFFLTDFPEKEGQHMGGATAVYGVFEGAYASFLLGVEGRALDATEPGENPYLSDTAKDVYREAIDRASNFLLRYYDAPADALTDKVDACARRYFATYWRDEAAAEQEKETMPLLPSVSPNNFKLLDDLLDKTMFKRAYEGVTTNDAGKKTFVYMVDQAGKDEKKAGKILPVRFSTTYMGPEITINQEPTPDDLFDIEAISTLILEMQWAGISAPYLITDDEIWRFESGLLYTNRTPNKKEGQELSARIDKMQYTKAVIDFAEEAKQRNYSFKDPRFIEPHKSENMILATAVDVKTVKGRVVTARAYYKIPILYQYSLEKGDLIYADYSLFEVGDGSIKIDKKQNDDFIRLARRYLVQQIYLLAEGKRKSKKILYNSIYASTCTMPPEKRYDPSHYKKLDQYKAEVRQARLADRKKIKNILDQWKAKKVIRGYKETKEGQKYTGVEIEINPDYFKKSLPDNRG